MQGLSAQPIDNPSESVQQAPQSRSRSSKPANVSHSTYTDNDTLTHINAKTQSMIDSLVERAIKEYQHNHAPDHYADMRAPPELTEETRYSMFKLSLRCWARLHEHISPSALALRALESSFKSKKSALLVSSKYNHDPLPKDIDDILDYLDLCLEDQMSRDDALQQFLELQQTEDESTADFASRFFPLLYAADLTNNLECRVFVLGLAPEIRSKLPLNIMREGDLSTVIAAATDIEAALQSHRPHKSRRNRNDKHGSRAPRQPALWGAQGGGTQAGGK